MAVTAARGQSYPQARYEPTGFSQFPAGSYSRTPNRRHLLQYLLRSRLCLSRFWCSVARSEPPGYFILSVREATIRRDPLDDEHSTPWPENHQPGSACALAGNREQPGARRGPAASSRPSPPFRLRSAGSHTAARGPRLARGEQDPAAHLLEWVESVRIQREHKGAPGALDHQAGGFSCAL